MVITLFYVYLKYVIGIAKIRIRLDTTNFLNELIMKVYELLTFNKELLKRIHSAGLRTDDYKYVDLYNEYKYRSNAGEKVTYIVAVLAAKYNVSERQVYKIVRKFSDEVVTANPGQ